MLLLSEQCPSLLDLALYLMRGMMVPTKSG